MSEASQPDGPDLSAGIADESLADGGMLVGHVGQESVLLARRGSELFAIDAKCTHYGGPLGEGLLVGDSVRCPWHHACFSLRTGEALAGPALTDVHCWRVEREGRRLIVRERLPAAGGRAARGRQGSRTDQEHIVIIGGGAAGFAAAQRLRREGYGGALSLLSADEDAPYDRPNLSKDYLAGTAQEDWIPLRPPDFYAEQGIELHLRTTVCAIDPAARRVILEGAEPLRFSRLLIATGAEPVRLEIPGAGLSHVHTLRSLADCRRIIGSATAGAHAVIVGASFIGLECAAALRQRGLQVHVVAPEQRPMERVLGPMLGDFLRTLHESHGVVFHLGQRLQGIDAHSVQLEDGSRLRADIVLVGIGVRPRLELAEKAGLAVDRGILVNEYLETSVPGVFAAGDVARWPDAYSGERLRIEHWVIAERQGQTAARNMLGQRERFSAPPFFWTQHYDVSINYVGHASDWERIELDGSLDARDASLRYKRGDRTLAVATVFRDRDSLTAELDMQQGRFL